MLNFAMYQILVSAKISNRFMSFFFELLGPRITFFDLTAGINSPLEFVAA